MAEKKNKAQFGVDPAYVGKFKWELAFKRIVANQRSDFIHAPHFRIIFQKKPHELRDILAGELRNGRFSPAPPVTIDVPKSSRMEIRPKRQYGPSFSRPGSILLPKERLLYQIFADFAAPIVQKRVDNSRAFSHWLAPGDAAEMFLPNRDCWARMQKALSKLAAGKGYDYVLKLDLANCFASINLHTLVNFLEAVSCYLHWRICLCGSPERGVPAE